MSKLFIVPTPIGNLKDITFRALEVLKEADLILANAKIEAESIKRKLELDKKEIITTLNRQPNNFAWNGRDGYKEKYEYILHWIRAPRREALNIRELTLDSAYAMAEEWHENLEISKENDFKEEGDVFIDYRNADGTGYYWVHLHSNYCSKEADRMGHCARSSNGELISFRKINEFGEGESYLTVDYRPGGIIGDFHRHGNNKPTARFHKQIVDFLIKLN